MSVINRGRLPREPDAGRPSLIWRAVVDRLLPLSPVQVIAYSRLALASFTLVAIFVDPTQPARNSDLAYLILAAYVSYAAALAVVSGAPRAYPRGALAAHALDIATSSALIVLTDGPTSPFFVFFTFVIISGALRWGARGAIGTASILLSVFLTVSVIDLTAPGDDDPIPF